MTGAAAGTSFNELPKIDFRRIYSDNLSDRQELAKEVGAACRDVGFFYAVNHGVDESLLDDTFDALKRFFDLPKEVKMEVHNQRTSKFRGYVKLFDPFDVVADIQSDMKRSLKASWTPAPEEVCLPTTYHRAI